MCEVKKLVRLYQVPVDMQMHFVFSNNVTLLFDFWTVQTLAGLMLSFVVVLLLTVLYEILKVLKSNKLTQLQQTSPFLPPNEPNPTATSDPETCMNSEPLLSQESFTEGLIPPTSRWWFLHTSIALLHTIQVVLGYMLMLCVMSYNAAIFLAVIFGSGLGYFLAFPLLAKYHKPHTM